MSLTQMATAFIVSIPSLSYDEFVTGCCNRKITQEIITTYNLDKKETSFLVRALALRYYPHELMTPPITLADREIIQQATSLITLSPSDTLFRSTFNHFKSLLTQWLILDKHRVVLPFITKLNQLRQLRTTIDTERPYYSTELKQLIDLSLLQLIGQINGLGGEEALSRIDPLLSATERDEAFDQQFRSDGVTAFWQTYQERQPSHVEAVTSLLVDFIHRYGRLVPHRPDLLASVLEILDIEFIKQKLETRVISADELRGYLRYILNLTKELGSSGEEAEVELRFGALISAEVSIVELLRNYFIPLFEHLDKIEVTVGGIMTD